MARTHRTGIDTIVMGRAGTLVGTLAGRWMIAAFMEGITSNWLDVIAFGMLPAAVI